MTSAAGTYSRTTTSRNRRQRVPEGADDVPVGGAAVGVAAAGRAPYDGEGRGAVGVLDAAAHLGPARRRRARAAVRLEHEITRQAGPRRAGDGVRAVARAREKDRRERQVAGRGAIHAQPARGRGDAAEDQAAAREAQRVRLPGAAAVAADEHLAAVETVRRVDLL